MKFQLNSHFQRTLVRSMLLLAAALLTACASGPTADRRDPLEPLNRGVFRFNDAVDRAAIKPAATAYRDVVPSPVRTGINNFFSNLQDAWSAVNNALQLNAEAAGNSAMRFGVNTVFGLGGLLDIASEMRIERHTKDFGHTLGYWGVPPGPYIVMPLLGPSTLRDTAAKSVDVAGNLLSGLDDHGARNTATALKLLDSRAQLLGASAMLEQIALDPYTFTRDAHLQRRRASIYDGYPPDEEEVMPDLDKAPAQ
jgi:phospholipid-binding lipoprotein MlaA